MSTLSGVVHPNIYHNRAFLEDMLDAAGYNQDLNSRREIYRARHLEAGQQNGSSFHHKKTDGFCLVHGQIYNLPDLQQLLKQEGVDYQGFSLSKTLYYLFESKQENAIKYINGDFALVYYDGETQTLFLFRDRVGKKNLYWSKQKGYFLFSTHMKALLHTGLVPQKMASESLAAYLFFGFFPHDLTPLEKIYRLSPGHYLKYKPSGALSIHSYWSPESAFSQRSLELDDEAWLQGFENELSHALSRRMKADTDKSLLYLGGGLGSASLSHLMLKTAPEKSLSTACVSIAKSPDHDLKAAQSIAAYQHLEHSSYELSPRNLLKNLTSIIWELEVPVADSNIFFLWEFCQQSSNKYESFFTGLGARELLGMHTKYAKIKGFSHRNESLSHFTHSLLSKCLPLLSFFKPEWKFHVFQYLNASKWDPAQLLDEILFTQKERKLLSPKSFPHFHPSAYLESLFPSSYEKYNPRDAYLLMEMHTSLANRFCLQFENIANHFHLKWYAPFLDHTLIDYVATMPLRYRGQKEGFSLLQQMLKKQAFPDSVLDRGRTYRKNLFDHYMDQPSLQKLGPFLLSGLLVESGLLNPHMLKKLVITPPVTHYSFNRFLAILSLEIWFRLFMVNPIAKEASQLAQLDELLKE